MTQSHTSPKVLVALLVPAAFLVRTAALMLGPLLIALAAAFHTSVAAAEQLAAAINLSWALTALLAGPVSDTYGRRRVGLMGLLIMAVGPLGSVLAWNYGALLTCCLLTGVGEEKKGMLEDSPQEGQAFSTRKPRSRAIFRWLLREHTGWRISGDAS